MSTKYKIGSEVLSEILCRRLRELSDAYKSIKKNVLAFAEMHGKSEVIEEQLKLEENQ